MNESSRKTTDVKHQDRSPNVKSISTPRPWYTIRAWQWLVIGIAVGTIPTLVAATLNVQTQTNDFSGWLPNNSLENKKYKDFQTAFGQDEFIFVSWPECELDNQLVPKLVDTLHSIDDVMSVDEETPVKGRILAGPVILEQLMDEPTKISRTSALQRLKGFLVGPDEKKTCILYFVPQQRLSQSCEVLQLVQQAADDTLGEESTGLVLGGFPFIRAQMDVEVVEDMSWLVPLTFAIAFVFALFFFRELRLVLIVGFIGLFSSGIAMAIIYHSGRSFSGVLIAVPTFLIVMAISGAIHMINYYRDSGSIDKMLADGWQPCGLAVLTTSIGLFSLLVSQTQSVRDFGWIAATSLLASYCIMMLLLPVLLTIWSGKPKASVSSESQRNGLLDRMVGILSSIVVPRPKCWALLGLTLCILGGYGLSKTKADLDANKMFSERSPVTLNNAWIAKNIGINDTTEILISFESADKLDYNKRFAAVRKIHSQVLKLPRTKAAMSAVSFAPNLPSSARHGSVVKRRLARNMYRARLEAAAEDFEDAGFLTQINGKETWRISARTELADLQDYERYSDEIGQIVNEVAKLANTSAADITTETTGITPVFFKAQERVFRDLVVSFSLAFVVIMPIVMFVVRSFAIGLVAMVPNLFPAIVVFGALGWINIAVDLSIMITASVALGIAVDDTLHFLTWFNRFRKRGNSVREAVKLSIQQCGPAMIQTSLICGCGLLVFAFGNYVPNIHFAWMMFWLLMAAVIGDLVFLPAILQVGPGVAKAN